MYPVVMVVINEADVAQLVEQLIRNQWSTIKQLMCVLITIKFVCFQIVEQNFLAKRPFCSYPYQCIDTHMELLYIQAHGSLSNKSVY
jgi:hypothetical protein